MMILSFLRNWSCLLLLFSCLINILCALPAEQDAASCLDTTSFDFRESSPSQSQSGGSRPEVQQTPQLAPNPPKRRPDPAKEIPDPPSTPAAPPGRRGPNAKEVCMELCLAMVVWYSSSYHRCSPYNRPRSSCDSSANTWNVHYSQMAISQTVQYTTLRTSVRTITVLRFLGKSQGRGSRYACFGALKGRLGTRRESVWIIVLRRYRALRCDSQCAGYGVLCSKFNACQLFDCPLIRGIGRGILLLVLNG
jgi:hypothetical protein